MTFVRCAMCVVLAMPLGVNAEARDVEGEAAAAIAHRFAGIAGNEENAVALALSLRNGDRVTLVQDAGGARVPVTTVFELPTRAMGWDDVRICLALVEDSLARQGVRNPTPEQLEEALVRVLQHELRHFAPKVSATAERADE
jgi:hypothetical protein